MKQSFRSAPALYSKLRTAGAFAAGVLIFTACNNADAPATQTDSTTTKSEASTQTAAPDYRSYAQYVSCSINGQPYLAYSADGHSSNISNPVNMPTRTDFATSADQVEMNGGTKISELHFLFFDLAKKGAGTYTSPKEFYMDGHTSFPEGAVLKEVHFIIAEGQQLTVSSVKDSTIEGSFAFDALDENDKSKVLKITDGHFKLHVDGGIKSLKVNSDGDVDMDKLIKDATK